VLFLSLGSNYDFKGAWRHALSVGRRRDSEELQKLLTKRYDGQKTLLFSKGRDALAAAVRLVTGGSGQVAVNALTCYSVIEAVESAGCEAVYVDVSPKDLHFSAKSLAEVAKSGQVKAVIIQNTIGIPVEIDQILQVAKQAKIAVIEDIAHAVGGKYADGREIGSVGDYTMLSFGRDKLLDTVNGGALVIRADKAQASLKPPLQAPGWLAQFRDRIYPLIGHASRVLYPIGLGKYILGLGYKLRLVVKGADGGADTDMRLPHWQARLALRQLKLLEETVANRLFKQGEYLAGLADFSIGTSSNAIRTPLLVANRKQVFAVFEEAGFFIKDSWYDVPVIPERLYHLANFPEGDLPIATKLAQHLINLPTHQQVKSEDVAKISEIILKEAEPWKS